MKLVLVAVITLLAISPLVADQGKPTQEELLKRGARKITIGVVLVAAGAVVMPITNMSNDEAKRGLGASFILTGAGVAVWGVRDRYNAVRPELTFGARIGKSPAVYVGRRW